MANIKSQKKRVLTNEKAHKRNVAVKSSLKTAVRATREAIAALHGMFDAGAAMAFNRGAQKSEGSHLPHDFAVKVLFPIGCQNARLKPVLTVLVRGIANGSLFSRQLAVQPQRVCPGKRFFAHVLLTLGHHHGNTTGSSPPAS